MKKLFSFIVLFVAVLCGANAFAYNEYINDPCHAGINETYWDVNKNTKFGVLTLDDGSRWPGWFYDAQGQIFGAENPVTDKVSGLMTLASKAFRVAEEGEMFFSMGFYVHTPLQKSNMRNFGARIRLMVDNNWDTLFTIRPQDGEFPIYRSGHDGMVEVPIGDKYNGKNVVLEIFFYNDPIASDPFIMLFHDIFCASYGTEHYIENNLTSRPFAYGNTYEAVLNCANQSTAPITSMEYAYSVNGKAEKKQTLTIPDTLKRGEAVLFALDVDITEAAKDAQNRVQIWPVTINGQAYVAKDSIDFDLTVIDESRLDQNHVPMLEDFTSSYCTYCQSLNPYLDAALEELKSEKKINVVKYQINIPATDKYCIGGNLTRSGYYGVTAAPTLVFDGIEKPIADWGCTKNRELMNELKKRTNAASKNKSFFTIKMNKAYVAANDIMEIDFDVTSHLLGDNRMLVYAMVIEGTTYGNAVVLELEKEFHYVNMAFATPESGKATYFSQDEPVNFTFSVDMKKTHMEEPEDLQVVVFVQDPSDKYIYQSAGVARGEAAVEGEELSQVALYPNPASHMVHVAGLESARVEIFDLTGRKVYEKVDASDVLEVSLASFAKGTYVVRIAQKGAVSSHKLVVK